MINPRLLIRTMADRPGRRLLQFVAVFAAVVPPAHSAVAEELIWGVQIEQLEYRSGGTEEVFPAWDFDAVAGSDELKFLWRSEAEYDGKSRRFESLENQIRIQTPVSDFFDAVAGVRHDAPKDADRVSGVVGLHGLAKQWFEIDADLFLSEHPSARLEVEYEGLITNYVTVTPSLEIDLPFTDDEEFELRAWGPKVELGMRLGYDLIDRSASPYIGLHYEQLLGRTKRLADADGRRDNGLFGVAGVRLQF